MAFFVSNDQNYFSLSLDPAGPNKAYIFRLSDRQVDAARIALPCCLAISAAAAMLTLALVVADYSPLSDRLASRQQDLAICAMAIAGGLAVLVELLWFLWVYTAPRAKLSEPERRSLGVLRPRRRPSMAAYWSFLLATSVPVLGLLALHRIDPAPMTGPLSSLVIAGPLAAGTAVLVFGLIKRLM